jgi:hypothetical protein
MSPIGSPTRLKLTPTLTLSAESVYQRHAELVDLSFARGLSHSEAAELQEIEHTRDILESPRLKPLKDAIEKEAERLSSEQNKNAG